MKKLTLIIALFLSMGKAIGQDKDTTHVHKFKYVALPQCDMGNGRFCLVAHGEYKDCECGAKPTMENMFGKSFLVNVDTSYLWLKTINDTSWVSLKHKYDTIPILLLCSDTSLQDIVAWQNGIQYDTKEYDYSVKWVIGYMVKGRYLDYGETTVYLDDKKIPLPKNIVVWQTK